MEKFAKERPEVDGHQWPFASVENLGNRFLQGAKGALTRGRSFQMEWAVDSTCSLALSEVPSDESKWMVRTLAVPAAARDDAVADVDVDADAGSDARCWAPLAADVRTSRLSSVSAAQHEQQF